MATTNREFDDDKVLEKLAEFKRLNIHGYEPYPEVEVRFDSPELGVVVGAEVVATLTWKVSAKEADVILDHARGL